MSANGPDAGDERDDKVDAAWRALSDASPPPDLDDSIRAAARRAVHAKPAGPKARAPWPAWMTFAAAASIGVIAIGVWKMMPQETDATRTVSDVPVTAQSAAPGIADAQRQATVAAKARPSAPSQSAKVAAVPRALQAPVVPPPPAVPPPPPVATEEPATPPPSTAGAVTARAPSAFPGAVRNAPMAAGRAEASADAAKPAAAPGPADAKTNANTVATPSPGPAAATADAKSTATDKVVRSFDDYILAIRRALDAKHDDDAVKELQALRNAYPDADERMPVDLRSWAFRIRK